MPERNIEDRADPEHPRQLNVTVPQRLVVALKELVIVEKIHNTNTLTQGDVVSDALKQYFAQHPLSGHLEDVVRIHFEHEREYVEIVRQHKSKEQS